MNRQELKQAYNDGLIDEDTFKTKLFELEQVPKKDKKPKRIYDPVNEEEFAKLLKVTKKLNHRVGFILGYASGLRAEEIVTLAPEDINLKSRKIHVREGKGGKDRNTFIAGWLRESHLKVLPIKIGVRALQRSFLRSSLKCGINRVIATYKLGDKEIPIYRLKLHSLRRGFAALLMKRHVPPNVVQAFMGHANLSTTNQYTKVNAEDAIEQALQAWDK